MYIKIPVKKNRHQYYKYREVPPYKTSKHDKLLDVKKVFIVRFFPIESNYFYKFRDE